MPAPRRLPDGRPSSSDTVRAQEGPLSCSRSAVGCSAPLRAPTPHRQWTEQLQAPGLTRAGGPSRSSWCPLPRSSLSPGRAQAPRKARPALQPRAGAAAPASGGGRPWRCGHARHARAAPCHPETFSLSPLGQGRSWQLGWTPGMAGSVRQRTGQPRGRSSEPDSTGAEVQKPRPRTCPAGPTGLASPQAEALTNAHPVAGQAVAGHLCRVAHKARPPHPTSQSRLGVYARGSQRDDDLRSVGGGSRRFVPGSTARLATRPRSGFRGSRGH